MLIWALTGGTFLATVLVVLFLLYAVFPADQTGRKAPKMANQQRAGGAVLKDSGPKAVLASDRRRSERLDLRVPVFVYGHASDEEPFYEETKTRRVNVQGALVTMAMGVKRGQKLLLANAVTQEEQECYVVHLGPKHLNRKTDVAIEFTRPAPDFWRMES